MIATGFGFITAALLLWTWHLLGNHGSRIDELVTRNARNRIDVFGATGRPISSLAKRRLRTQLSDGEARAIGLTTCIMLLSLVLAPALVIVAPAVCAAVILHRRRRNVIARKRAILRSLPVTVDLLRLSVLSGLNISAAVSEVAAHTKGPLADELTRAMQMTARGVGVADALDGVVVRTCDEVGPLIWSLTSSERYGAPLSEVLERLARETRLDQERRAEQAARQLSVLLLFPLAGAILPAFALLTVVPLLAGSLSSLASNF